MRSPGARVCALLFFVALAACGGSTVSTGSGDGGATRDGGGRACTPLPGCTSTTSCPATDGCNTCACEGGSWACTELACVDAGPPVDGDVCPSSTPTAGTACASEGLECGPGGCGTECTCTSGAWSCVEPPCIVPCPLAAPATGSACTLVDEVCFYPQGGACNVECTCDPARAWQCASCNDGGAPDGGAAAACTAAGGTVTTQECCASSGDFPDQCAIGACSCAPGSSHMVQTCACAGGMCWNGSTCM